MIAPRSLKSVRARLTLGNVGVLALVLAALGAILRVGVEQSLMASVDREITSRARRQQDFWRHPPPGFEAWFKGRREAGPPPGPPRQSSSSDRTSRGGRGDPKDAIGPSGLPRRPAPGFGRPRDERRGPRPGPPPMRFESTNAPASPWQAQVIERNFYPDGRPFPFGDQSPSWDIGALSLAADGQEAYTVRKLNGQAVRIFSAPLRLHGPISAVVQVGASLASVEIATGNMDRTLLMLVPIALLAAGGGGLILTGRMLRPVRDVTSAAAQIGADDLSSRLPVSGGGEFSELAATFNGMLARLERAFEQQRRFTADASHELRTPLTVIKANTSLALSRKDLAGEHRRVIESVDRAATAMTRIVQDLLLLARSDAGQLAIELRTVRVSDLLDSVIACVPNDGAAAICCRIADPDLTVLGDPSHLARLFSNLLENSIRYTPAGGAITISANRQADGVAIAVADTGIGIGPEHLPHVCERFYRSDDARSRGQGGTGLGLAICQTIVAAHGGKLEIESVSGAGTTVRVTLRSA